MQRQLLWAIGVLGVVVFVIGAVVLFTSDHDARSGFLLTLGLVLTLIALLGDRIQLEGFEILGAKVRVREACSGGRAEYPGQGAYGREDHDQR